MKKNNIFFIVLLVVFDQLVKYVVETTKAVFDLNIFKINFVTNRGIAYGLLENGDSILIILVSLIIVIGIITYLFMKKEIRPIANSGLVLILSGGIGNLVDRIVRGFVIDYIDITKWINFPIFNISDIFITLGVILVIIHLMKEY